MSRVDPPPRQGTAARLGWLTGGAVVGALIALAIVVAALTLLNSTGAQASAPPRFVEETATAGIDHRYGGGFEFFVGGGVAAFDCNDDGFQDVYLAGGEHPGALYENHSTHGGTLRFAARPSTVTDLERVTGAYPLDVDADGITDLAVLRHGDNVMLRGLGDCTFEPAPWGIDGRDAWTTAFSATWAPSADLPTLAFGNYLTPDGRQTGMCEDHELFQPGPDGYAATSLTPGFCALSMLFSDWNRSGRHDLRVSNDRQYYRDGQEQLWRIEPGAAPRLWSAEEGWRPLQIFGMGIASHDVTGDGIPEVFLTSIGDNKLQTLVAGTAAPRYEDIALERGVTAHRPFTGERALPSVAWHPQFADINNDGFIDLFIAKGNVDSMEGAAMRDPSNVLLGNADGTFTEAAEAAGILSFGRARGAALVDFNLDGMLDLIEVNRSEPLRLWRNVGRGDEASPEPIGDWVALRLSQTGANTDAIGAWIEVRVGGRMLTREVTVGGGHAGGQLGWIHFGLGDAETAEVRVQWPDGETGPWVRIDTNQFVNIERGAEPRTWSPSGVR